MTQATSQLFIEIFLMSKSEGSKSAARFAGMAQLPLRWFAKQKCTGVSVTPLSELGQEVQDTQLQVSAHFKVWWYHDINEWLENGRTYKIIGCRQILVEAHEYGTQFDWQNRYH